MAENKSSERARIERDYIRKGGAFCPECGSPQITAGSNEADGNYIVSKVRCEEDACGAEWQDIFTLTGMEVTERGQKAKA